MLPAWPPPPRPRPPRAPGAAAAQSRTPLSPRGQPCTRIHMWRQSKLSLFLRGASAVHCHSSAQPMARPGLACAGGHADVRRARAPVTQSPLNQSKMRAPHAAIPTHPPTHPTNQPTHPSRQSVRRGIHARPPPTGSRLPCPASAARARAGPTQHSKRLFLFLFLPTPANRARNPRKPPEARRPRATAGRGA
jgi:hypothetical protein